LGADVAAVVIFKPVTDPEILKQLNEDDPKFDNKAAATNKSKRVEFRGESIRFPVEVTDEEIRAVLARDYPWARQASP
jgi:hypothetical protein